MAGARGFLALVLQAHLPWVRHPEHEAFLEEEWLFEAITELPAEFVESGQLSAGFGGFRLLRDHGFVRQGALPGHVYAVIQARGRCVCDKFDSFLSKPQM